MIEYFKTKFTTWLSEFNWNKNNTDHGYCDSNLKTFMYWKMITQLKRLYKTNIGINFNDNGDHGY